MTRRDTPHDSLLACASAEGLSPAAGGSPALTQSATNSENSRHHPEIQAAIDSMPHPLEPWGMMHILAACNKIAIERDRLRAETPRKLFTDAGAAELDTASTRSETAPLVAGDLKTQREIHDSYAPSATPRNQCDGCQRGLPNRISAHGTVVHDGPDGMPVMACTSDRYTASATSPEVAKLVTVARRARMHIANHGAFRTDDSVLDELAEALKPYDCF